MIKRVKPGEKLIDRREFLANTGGLCAAVGAYIATSGALERGNYALSEVDEGNKDLKTVYNPRELGDVINARKPSEVLYDLGEGERRTELLVTHLDGDNIISSDRIAISPRIRLYEEAGEISMDFIPSGRDVEGRPYKDLRLQGANFEQPNHPKYELGDLAIDLGKGRQLVITQFYRAEESYKSQLYHL